MVLVADDTNVWLNKTTRSYQPELGKECEVKGTRKVQALLGMLWTVALKRAGSDSIDAVLLHAPSQVLPKANAGTIWDRVRRWGVYCGGSCAEPFGGERLYEMFQHIPLKLMIWCNWAVSVAALYYLICLYYPRLYIIIILN